MESMYEITKRRKWLCTQAQLAEEVDMLQPQLSLLENGWKSPTESTLKRLSAGLDAIEMKQNETEE